MKGRAALTIVVLIVFGSLGCPPSQPVWNASDVAISFGSVPAQVCILVNQERNTLLTERGEAIHQQAITETWSADQEREAILAIHEVDNQIRAIVSPGWYEDGEQHTGLCSSTTRTIETFANSVGGWEDMGDEGWTNAVAETVRLFDDVNRLLGEFGVANLYSWLNEKGALGGQGLGDLLSSVLRFMAVFLESGLDALQESGGR